MVERNHRRVNPIHQAPEQHLASLAVQNQGQGHERKFPPIDRPHSQVSADEQGQQGRRHRNTAPGAGTRLKRAVSAKTTTTLKSPALQILG